MNVIDQLKLRNKSYQTQVFEELKAKLLGEIFTNVSDYQSEIIEQILLFDELTEKSEKLKLLSVLPQSWSAGKIRNEIGVTKHMANKIEKLVKNKGIFFNAEKKIGRQSIESETVESVINFYRDDEISKVMPGMRDCIVYKDNMKKQKVQRRLVLYNLREVHELFRKKYPNQKKIFFKICHITAT